MKPLIKEESFDNLQMYKDYGEVKKEIEIDLEQQNPNPKSDRNSANIVERSKTDEKKEASDKKFGIMDDVLFNSLCRSAMLFKIKKHEKPLKVNTGEPKP